MTVKDMDRDFERTQHMVFVEFLEFLCRVAHIVTFNDMKKGLQCAKSQLNESSGDENF